MINLLIATVFEIVIARKVRREVMIANATGPA
jgi:hypothetical protein